MVLLSVRPSAQITGHEVGPAWGALGFESLDQRHGHGPLEGDTTLDQAVPCDSGQF